MVDLIILVAGLIAIGMIIGYMLGVYREGNHAKRRQDLRMKFLRETNRTEIEMEFDRWIDKVGYRDELQRP